MLLLATLNQELLFPNHYDYELTKLYVVETKTTIALRVLLEYGLVRSKKIHFGV